MREMIIALIATVFIGCGGGSSVGGASNSTEEPRYSLWDYIVPSSSATNFYDLILYDLEGNVVSSYYNSVSLEYSYINSNYVTETSSLYSNVYSYVKSDYDVKIDGVSNPLNIKINDFVNECIVSDLNTTAMVLNCTNSDGMDIKTYYKGIGLVGRVTEATNLIGVLSIVD